MKNIKSFDELKEFLTAPTAFVQYLTALYALKQVMPGDDSFDRIVRDMGVWIGCACAYSDSQNELVAIANGKTFSVSLAPSVVEKLRKGANVSASN